MIKRFYDTVVHVSRACLHVHVCSNVSVCSPLSLWGIYICGLVCVLCVLCVMCVIHCHQGYIRTFVGLCMCYVCVMCLCVLCVMCVIQCHHEVYMYICGLVCVCVMS